MAHVKCSYQRFFCTADGDPDVTGDCFTCKADFVTNDPFDESCPCLELRLAYIDSQCKSVKFDGESLYVGGKYVCSLDIIGQQPVADDTYINQLEIDGECFVKDGKAVTEC